MASNFQQLKRLVEALNTPKDTTVDHRRKIADMNSSIQRLAKSIKDSVTAALHEGGSGMASTSASPAEMQGKGINEATQRFRSDSSLRWGVLRVFSHSCFRSLELPHAIFHMRPFMQMDFIVS